MDFPIAVLCMQCKNDGKLTRWRDTLTKKSTLCEWKTIDRIQWSSSYFSCHTIVVFLFSVYFIFFIFHLACSVFFLLLSFVASIYKMSFSICTQSFWLSQDSIVFRLSLFSCWPSLSFHLQPDINFLLISIQFNLTLLVGYTNVAIFELVKCEPVYGYVIFVELMVFHYIVQIGWIYAATQKHKSKQFSSSGFLHFCNSSRFYCRVTYRTCVLLSSTKRKRCKSNYLYIYWNIFHSSTFRMLKNLPANDFSTLYERHAENGRVYAFQAWIYVLVAKGDTTNYDEICTIWQFIFLQSIAF